MLRKTSSQGWERNWVCDTFESVSLYPVIQRHGADYRLIRVTTSHWNAVFGSYIPLVSHYWGNQFLPTLNTTHFIAHQLHPRNDMREEDRIVPFARSLLLLHRKTPDSLINGFLSVGLHPSLKRRDVKAIKNLEGGRHE
jgi:hypothetical protein